MTTAISDATLSKETIIPREAKHLTEKRPRRGGATKKAPPGYYTASEARKKLRLKPSTFSLYVSRGKIQRYVPPLRREGYYRKEEIDQLASEIEAFWGTTESEQESQ